MAEQSVPAYQPVIIIGAGRSGTNMLRDILVTLPGFGTWPCDEINYIWRHGNHQAETDAFSTDLATEEVKSFICRAFEKRSRRDSLDFVVEKTCANSLRVAFIHEIFPTAKFVFIVRDGRDVVASAQQRWTASLDIPYILRKARFVPMQDLPYYGLRYWQNRLYRWRSRDRRLASWGPKYPGMAVDLQKYSLPEVCARQWRYCVEAATQALAKLDPAQVHRLRYEDFVAHPADELAAIASFLGVSLTLPDCQRLVRGVATSSVGKWQQSLDPELLERSIMPIIYDTLAAQGYL